MNIDDEFDMEYCKTEDYVLGALLVSPQLIGEMMAVVQPGDFERPTERAVYRLMCDMHKDGVECSAATLRRKMKEDGLDRNGYGADWIATLVHRAPSVYQAIPQYGKDLRRLALLRSQQRLFRQALAQAMSPDGKPDAIFDTALNDAADLQETYAGPDSLAPVDYYAMLEQNPELHEPVIEGVLRQGETCNIIAAPKIGKSFLSVGLAWSVATGRPWLSFDVAEGRVLIIDNELHEPTLSHRIDNAAYSMQIPQRDRAGKIDCISLRGKLCDINQIHERLIRIKPGEYKLVILDALYRTLPSGTSENDNAAMMAVYNRLDQYAAKLQAAFVVVHHSSKGSQSDKGLTDVGAGAGSISRAADTHMVIRPHEQEGHAVLEAVTRSFKSPEPLSIVFDYPLWNATTLDPEIKRNRSKNEERQQAQDAETDAEVLRVISGSSVPMSLRQVREQTTYGETRVQRAIVRLKQAGKITAKRMKSKKTGKSAERYAAVDVPRDVPPESAGHRSGHHDVPHARIYTGAGHDVSKAKDMPANGSEWKPEKAK